MPPPWAPLLHKLHHLSILSNSAVSLKCLKKQTIEVDCAPTTEAGSESSILDSCHSSCYVRWLAESLGWGTGPWSHRHLGITFHPQAAVQNCVHRQKASCETMQWNYSICPVKLCNETIPFGHALNEHTNLRMDIDSPSIQQYLFMLWRIFLPLV